MQEPQNNVSYTRIHQSDDKAASACALLQYYLQSTSYERGKGGRLGRTDQAEERTAERKRFIIEGGYEIYNNKYKIKKNIYASAFATPVYTLYSLERLFLAVSNV